MNRNDKLIVALLFVLLMGWLWYSGRMNQQARERAALERPAAAALSTNAAATAALTAAPGATAAVAATAPVVPPAPEPPPTAHLLPEQTATLRAPDMELQVSSRGAVLTNATLPDYRAEPRRDSGPVNLSFVPQPALALSGLPGIPADADYTLVSDASNRVATLTCRTPDGLTVVRRIELHDRYVVSVTDRIVNAGRDPLTLGANGVALGTMYRGTSKNDEIAADSLVGAPGAKVHHWGKDLGRAFGGGGGFACLGGPARAPVDAFGRAETNAHQWVALKSRFFVQALSATATDTVFRLDAERDPAPGAFSVQRVRGELVFPGAVLAPGAALERTFRVYIGPKKLSYLSALGPRMDEIMEFGFFAWFCRPLVALLNFFHGLIPNYGVAIILLTLLVRLVFWPLTHKSTQGMKRMREAQPKIKAIQEQFKDDPRKLQQEMWRVYGEYKVKPWSSCLPMLLQIPVFIALYTMLRSAVELRFAPFLWVADLSQPENLFVDKLHFPVNLLPLAMAATTIWQSKLTPSMGDPAQQKMMTWMMPLMMLFFLYAMPAALSLYWTVSTLLAIAQIVWQQRGGAGAAGGPPAAPAAESMTRQMRRRLSR